MQNSLQTSSDLGGEAQGPFPLILGAKKKKTQEAEEEEKLVGQTKQAELKNELKVNSAWLTMNQQNKFNKKSKNLQCPKSYGKIQELMNKQYL